jgi:hypothetical protein
MENVAEKDWTLIGEVGMKFFKFVIYTIFYILLFYIRHQVRIDL